MKWNQQRQLLIYLASFAALAIIGFAVLLATRSFVRFIALAMLIVTGLFLIVHWHAHAFTYRCRICGHEFEISFWTDLFSPHWPGKDGGWKYLRCPACRRRMKAVVIEKAETVRTRPAPCGCSTGSWHNSCPLRISSGSDHETVCDRKVSEPKSWRAGIGLHSRLELSTKQTLSRMIAENERISSWN